MRQLPLALAALATTANLALADVKRTDFTVFSEPGIEIAIREVVDTDVIGTGDPIVLIHGARVPGIASFDLDVPGGSLAADLAAAGHAAFIVDLRGYGASTRPTAMANERIPDTPLVRSGAAVRDLDAAVDAIRARTGSDRVAILGWATGGHWGGMFSSLAPEKVSKLILYNTLYGYSADHPAIGRGSALSDPDFPDRFNIARFQNYRTNTADGLLPGWDRSIPLDDKTQWRDPMIAEAYVGAALASDPTSEDRDPPSFRAPSGAMADSFLLATGAALWDARLISADVLIVRSENDFWSRTDDVAMLQRHLDERRSGTVEAVELPHATHFVHLDRAERGRRLFLTSVLAFLAQGEG